MGIRIRTLVRLGGIAAVVPAVLAGASAAEGATDACTRYDIESLTVG